MTKWFKKIIYGCVMIIVLSCMRYAYGAVVWQPDPGNRMTDNVYNTDNSRRISWNRYQGFAMSVDNRAAYDNWRNVDNAPQVRLDLGSNGLNLSQTDFVISTRVRMTQSWGFRYQAGLCIVFGNNDLLAFGLHGREGMETRRNYIRIRRPGGVNRWQLCSSGSVYIKIKRRGTIYSAWYSEDGIIWSHLIDTTINNTPLYAGAILKTWRRGTQNADFRYFQITHVINEPTRNNTPHYTWNHSHGGGFPNPLSFVYDLQPSEERRRILLRIYIRQGDTTGIHPFDKKLYVSGFETYNRISGMLKSSEPIINQLNLTLVAIKFPSGQQTLKHGHDWMLIDIHEDFIRDRFPTSGNAVVDDKFYLTGQSAGGQFTARFAMCHAKKLVRAAAASPHGLSFPDVSIDWYPGIHINAYYRERNPRLAVNPEDVYNLELAIIHGENDNVVDRTPEPEQTQGIDCVGYSRVDEGKKWIRQMTKRAGRTIIPRVYIVPKIAHGLTGDKTKAVLHYLFGQGNSGNIERWRYRFTLDDEDNEVDVQPRHIPSELLYYSKFDCYNLPEYFAERRYTFHPGSNRCNVRKPGPTVSVNLNVPCSIVHTSTDLRITVGGDTYSNPKRLYGKLRLYNANRTRMLEESAQATRRFIDEMVVGRRFYIFEIDKRDDHGPALDPNAPVLQVILRENETVVNPDTNAPYPDQNTIRTWKWDDIKSRIIFKTRQQETNSSSWAYDKIHKFRVGEWRWGYDSLNRLFIAGLQTCDEHRIPRREMQTTSNYSRRLFEHWPYPGQRFGLRRPVRPPR
ncbi:MAG: hypothetical protein JSV88_24630 [Candidatus Aminicenantes bacterium]|nr:MAG: hypothetical protein JSV88_24630 [Candidatus Aminicenantes bacterium]